MSTMRKIAYCLLSLHIFLLLTACQNKTETTTFSSEGVTVEVPLDWRFNKFEEDGLYAPKEFTWRIGEFSSFGIYVYDRRKMTHFDEVTLEWFYQRFTRRSIPELANGIKIPEIKNTILINGMDGIHSVITIDFFGEISTDIKILQKETPNIRALILFNTISDDDEKVDLSSLFKPVLDSISITD